MAKLRVKRKGYTRKGYTRKDGTRVKASRVGGSSYLTKDRGKRGRTPKSERWYKPTTEMGWRKDMSATERRRLALKAHDSDNLSTARALLALSNVTTDPETKRLTKADAEYFFERHEKTGD